MCARRYSVLADFCRGGVERIFVWGDERLQSARRVLADQPAILKLLGAVEGGVKRAGGAKAAAAGDATGAAQVEAPATVEG